MRATRPCRPPMCMFAALAPLLLTCGARAQSSKVEITGDIDNSGQHYDWTITNHHTSPIVYIEIPHYHADTFRTPDGWTQKCTNLCKVGGGEDAPGTCTATAVENAGILPGAAAQFGVRLCRAGANHGRGTVRVRFADQTTFDVSGVALAVAPSFFEQFGTVIGLAVILLLFIVWQLRRRRRPASVNAILPK